MSRDRQVKPAAGEPEAPKHADETDDVLFGTFPEQGEDSSSDAHDGLELDAQQSAEVRGIFLTTLPQYLEPVDQMLELLFSAEGSTEDTREALVTTIASLRTAASRIGATDVLVCLERISDDLADLRSDGAPPSEAHQQRIRADLDEVRRVATGAGSAPSAKAGPASVTIFAALQGVAGLGEAVLERLTAAGLLTVDQLRIARPDEIAAVTGLDAPTVRAVLAAVDVARDPEIGPAAAEALDSPPADEAEPEPQDALPPIEPLDPSLEQALRAQVDAEASFDELWAEVQRGKGMSAELARQLATAEQRLAELEAEHPRIEAELQAKAAKLEELRARRAALRDQSRAHEELCREMELRSADLRRQVQRALARDRWLESTIADLQHRLARLLGRT